VGERHWGSMDSGGERSSVNSVGDTVMSDRDNRGVNSVNTVRENSISAVKSVGGISHDSGVSSEGLALGGGPVLSLVGLAHRLVAHLTMSVSINRSVGAIINWGNSGGDSCGQDGGMHSGVMGNSVNWGMDSGMVSNWGGVNSMMSDRVDRSSMDSMMSHWVDWGGMDSVMKRGGMNCSVMSHRVDRGSVDSVSH